jgi:hypothetical protein
MGFLGAKPLAQHHIVSFIFPMAISGMMEFKPMLYRKRDETPCFLGNPKPHPTVPGGFPFLQGPLELGIKFPGDGGLVRGKFRSCV